MTAWVPRYRLTPAMARALMEVGAAAAVVEHLAIPPAIREELRHRARVRSTHYSTRIEGNRLTLAEAEQAIRGSRVPFHGRERDAAEVRNYWNALLRMEEWAAAGRPLTEELIQRLHGLIERGARAKRSPWRDGQNLIRDSESGALVYLPPEAKDVPLLMSGLVAWVRQAEEERLPVPILAGLAHYQFVTIHPYYDGNGRTARLLATFLLHRGGHGLQGLFSLEEHHARDLAAYYGSLAVHPHHNYYEGRAEADLTPWLEYFLDTVARVDDGWLEVADSARRTRAYALSAIYRQSIGIRQEATVRTPDLGAVRSPFRASGRRKLSDFYGALPADRPFPGKEALREEAGRELGASPKRSGS